MTQSPKKASTRKASTRKASARKAGASPREAAKEPAPFPIIGIGASAGGIGALQKFFPEVPSDSGFAYVVVQHLDAEHESVLASIIQRCTEIDTQTAAEGMEVEPNNIYVVPPGVSVTVEKHRFHVAKMTSTRAKRTPIDDFFTSLAAIIRLTNP